MKDDVSQASEFHFSITTRVCFGLGARRHIPTCCQENHWDRVGVIIDHNLLPLPLIKAFLGEIEQAVSKITVLECSISEPSYHDLERLRSQLTDDLQVMIGIGGGSSLDMAKAMAVLVKNRGSAISYRGFDKMTEPVLPILAVPTTAGTGSEVTPNASFVDSDSKVKLGINGEAVRPKYAFLDPELTLSCPQRPTLSAAVDSLVHATEAFIAKKSNPLAKLFAKEGFNTVVRNLPKLMMEFDHIGYRSQVMYGAFLSGVALMHSGTGPAAALSYPLGVHYKVPHGIAGAMFLPHVVQYNVEQGVHDYEWLLEVDGNGTSLSAEKKAQRFVEKMFSLWRALGIPEKLSDVATTISKDLMIKDTLLLKGALEQNPVPFGEKQLAHVLSRLGVE